MLLNLLWFEIKKSLFKLSSIIYFGIFFSLSFFLSILFADAFQGITINFGLSDRLYLNSPIVINHITTIVGLFGILIAAPIFGQSIYQEFETGFQEIFFSSPIRKRTFFFIKFAGSFLVVIIILSSIGLGIWTATHMPFINKSLITHNHFLFYLAPYLSAIIPNMLVLGTCFTALAAISHKITPVYVASILLFSASLVAEIFLVDIENKFLAALLDPLGFIGAQETIQYWSVTEQNTRMIPLSSYFLYNRLLWGGVGAFIFFLGYFLFNPFKNQKEKKNTTEVAFSSFNFEKTKTFTEPKSFKIFVELSISEFKQAFSNTYFLIILLSGILFLLISSGQIGKIYGTKVLPVTYHVLEGISGSFRLFFIIITSFYAGELVWKDRDHRFYELVDSKPISNLFLYLSKLLSLICIQLFLLLLIISTCLLVQISNGYYYFEWNVYFQHLIYFLLPAILTSIFVIFAHTISKNKIIGHSVVISYYIFLAFLQSIGFDHQLYLIGSIPRIFYSDINKFGFFLYPFTIFTLYWGLFYLGIACLTLLFWLRGAILTWRDRLLEFKRRIQPVHKKILSGALFCWVGTGVFIYYNTNILNEYKTNSTQVKESVDYEMYFKKFEQRPHPEITSVMVHLDIYPKKRGISAKGVFKYKNCSDQPITEILLNLSEKVQINSLSWNKKTSLVDQDNRMGVHIFTFSEPLLPNEDIELSFQLNIQTNGFNNSGFPNKILENGTFFYGTDYFPIIGYMSSREISKEKIRKKYHLPEKVVPDLNAAINKTLFSHEGSWIDFEAILSTSKDQIAIAPGYLVRSWEENDRKYFHYKMDKPILNFYAFLSGRYEIATDQWNGVKIEIYHHPTHRANIARMIQAIKKSLDYYTQNFSPYQFNQIRIIEFPRYATFAQSFPNTIPFSESIGFIAKIKDNDPENFDYVFYITSHEIAHQWWGHQVVGGDVPGATMLSESLAQYSALMVQEKEYGPQQMKKFLKYEMDRYLVGRTLESKKESPLMNNEGQQYIHYNKGSLVFYALKDYLGEKTVNKILQEFIRDVAFQKGPFTRAVDLVERFKKETPEDLKYLIEDLFETITFYSNHTESVTFSEINDKYEVIVISDNRKFRSDGLGEEHEVPINDYIDVGVFDREGNILYLQKHKMKSGKNVFHIQVEKMPHKAGIDPINKLIDKNPNKHLLKAIKSV